MKIHGIYHTEHVIFLSLSLSHTHTHAHTHITMLYLYLQHLVYKGTNLQTIPAVDSYKLWGHTAINHFYCNRNHQHNLINMG